MSSFLGKLNGLSVFFFLFQIPLKIKRILSLTIALLNMAIQVVEFSKLSLVLLRTSDLTNELHLHQFLVTRSEEANKSVKTDANGAH